MEGSFGTQIKEILKNRNITIKALAEMIETETGMKMSRQNLNQRLSRDNFQEQDMLMIAKVLNCTLTISVIENAAESVESIKPVETISAPEQNTASKSKPEPVSEPRPNPVFETNYVNNLEKEIVPEPKPGIAHEFRSESSFESRNETVRKAVETILERRNPAFAEVKSEGSRSGSILGSGTRSALESIYSRMSDEEREAARRARDERLRSARLRREEDQKKQEEKRESEKARIKEIARRAIEASRNTSGSFIKEEKPVEAEVVPKSSVIKEFIKKEVDDNKSIIKEENIEPEENGQEIPAQELLEQEIEKDQSSEMENDAENTMAEGNDSEKEFSETLVEAARKSTEAAAATRNTADMGVVPDVFRRVGREEENNEPEINPRTGEEFESNVVRSHPRLKGYIQVYDRGEHKWIDMTEWAFLGFQERKKVMLGADYKPPVYLD